VKCIECTRFNLRTAGQMAKHGFGHCDLKRTKSMFVSSTWERECDKYDPAKADVAQKRHDWLSAQTAVVKVDQADMFAYDNASS